MMNRNSRLLFGVASFAFVAGAAQAQLLDGGFEMALLGDSALQTYYAGSTIGAWTVGKGSVDLKSSKSWQAADGNQSLDLAGFSNGSIWQDVPTVEGQEYTLTLYVSGHPVPQPPVKQMKIYWDKSLVAQVYVDVAGKTVAKMEYEYLKFTVTALGDKTRLTFENLESCECGYGVALDEISLVPVAEPSIAILGGAGVATFAGAHLRRRKNASGK